MSKCHFPHDNHTIILDFPSISNINNTMLLIETCNYLCPSSTISMACLQQSGSISKYQEVDDEDSLGLSLEAELESNNNSHRKKKTGCTCKKTNCLKMYCECFSTGKICTPECSCYGCYNDCTHQKLIQQAKEELKVKSGGSNRHMHRGCNCKKSQCQKKYCECYNAGLGCTEACNCCDCLNKEDLQERIQQNQEEQQ